MLYPDNYCVKCESLKLPEIPKEKQVRGKKMRRGYLYLNYHARSQQ